MMKYPLLPINASDVAFTSISSPINRKQLQPGWRKDTKVRISIHPSIHNQFLSTSLTPFYLSPHDPKDRIPRPTDLLSALRLAFRNMMGLEMDHVLADADDVILRELRDARVRSPTLPIG